jgi:hypothetical protein
MAYKIQLKDKKGNLQYPVTTTALVVDTDGKSVEQRLQELATSGGADISDFVTKSELAEAEKVTASALNDLNTRKADKQFVEDALTNIDTSDLATKGEVQDLTEEIIANEKVHAAALNDLNERINEILIRLNNAGI